MLSTRYKHYISTQSEIQLYFSSEHTRYYVSGHMCGKKFKSFPVINFKFAEEVYRTYLSRCLVLEKKVG